MTALPITSQVRYIINNDSLTCYTKQENRSIAVLLIKGERDSVKLDVCSKYTESVKLTTDILFSQVDSLNGMVKETIEIKTNLQFENNELNRKVKRIRNILIGSGSLNIILILILL